MNNELFEDEELTPETFIDNEQDADKQTIKEELKSYSDSRMNNSIISDTHKRATFLVADDVLNKLENFTFYNEATNSIGSSFTQGLSDEQIFRGRVMSKGIKSKLVNFAISKVLDELESQSGLIPEVSHKRFKVDKVNHNAYLFKEDGVTHYLEINNRGKMVEELSTDNEYSEDELQQKFDDIKDESVKQGRPKSK